jgi:glyoxylase-like metal-dependent hydrolase (beta-lactamase superfamily II)
MDKAKETTMSDGTFHFSLGDFSCTVFRDAIDARPLEFLTSSVSKQEVSQALVSLGLPGDRVYLSYNILMLERDGERTLVDCGLMQIENRQGELLKRLREEGIRPETIQHILVTHTDFDHVGGLISPEGALFYPEAQIMLTRDAWNWYASEDVLAKLDPKVADFFRKLYPVVAEHVVFVEGEQELIPGVCAISTPGHRPGHIALEISSQGQSLLHFGDAINNPVFVIRPDWLVKIDTDPEQGRETRKALFKRAADANALVFAAHPTFPGLGRISRERDGFQWRFV